LIFTSGVVSGVNSYAAVLVLGLIGRFGHVAAIPTVLEKPSVLVAAAVLYAGQFIVGKIPVLDVGWDLVHTVLRPIVGGAIGVVVAQHAGASTGATVAAALLGGGTALTSHVVKTGVRVGVNASPEPFSTAAVSLLEDGSVTALTWWAVYHPLPAAIATAVVLAIAVVLTVLLASRIRRAWRRRREARRVRRVLDGHAALRKELSGNPPSKASCPVRSIESMACGDRQEVYDAMIARRYDQPHPHIERTFTAVRAALPADNVGAFDGELQAITHAPVVDLSALDNFLSSWWRIATRASADPADWQQMHREAEQLQSGARSTGPTLAEVLSRRGIQL